MAASMKAVAYSIALTALTACSTPIFDKAPGFSFANYDKVVIGQPSDLAESAFTRAFNLQFANAIERSGMKIVGDKEASNFATSDQEKTLSSRIDMDGDEKHISATISFNEFNSGRVVASATAQTGDNIHHADERRDTFEKVMLVVKQNIAKDRGLPIPVK